MAKKDVPFEAKLLYPYAQAAAILDMSKPTLQKIVKAGLIRRMEVYGEAKFYIKELHAFCERMLDKGIDPKAPADEIISNLKTKGEDQNVNG